MPTRMAANLSNRPVTCAAAGKIVSYKQFEWGRAMTDRQAGLDTIPIIDVDSHVTEPVDLWTSRVSVAKWGDRVPHVRPNPADGEQCWYVGDTRLMGVASSALAGFADFWPSRPKR